MNRALTLPLLTGKASAARQGCTAPRRHRLERDDACFVFPPPHIGFVASGRAGR